MVTLINVYALPESSKSFLKILFDTIAIETKGILICGGDYNVVINHNLDTTSSKRSKMHLSKFINTLVQAIGLADVERTPSTRLIIHTIHYHILSIPELTELIRPQWDQLDNTLG